MRTIAQVGTRTQSRHHACFCSKLLLELGRDGLAPNKWSATDRVPCVTRDEEKRKDLARLVSFFLFLFFVRIANHGDDCPEGWLLEVFTKTEPRQTRNGGGCKDNEDAQEKAAVVCGLFDGNLR